uniref:CCHC-type domain-containing protein n=1 Tax=Tanacetum cinerariifolium TaxID=118510 RepID=A0A6L2K1A2_TANCI|nr:hypothetical protein [Tanacetum cinerariifolium]
MSMRTGRGSNGGLIILPPTTVEEHLTAEGIKGKNYLLQSIPDDHIVDFHYMDDARDIWNAVKARFGGNAESKKMRKSMLKQEFLEFRISETKGFHKEYDRMQKILSQLNQLNAKPDTKEINLRFLRALPSLWSQVALTLKTKGPSHSAFVSVTNTSKKMPYRDSPNHSSTTTYSVPSNSKTGSHRTGTVIKDVLQSFFADTKPEQQLAYEDLEQIEKLDLEEMDLKWKMAMLFVRVHKFKQKVGRKIDFDKKESARFNKQKVRCYKCQQRGHFARECMTNGGNDKQRYSSFKVKEIGRKEDDSKALITVDTLVDWSNHGSQSDEVIAAKEFGMIASCDSADAIKAGANRLYNLINGANSEEANTLGDAGEFALMGVTFEELSEYINSLSWNRPIVYYDDDDDEYSFAKQECLMTCSIAITLDSPKMNSLIMEDDHLDTISKTESGEFIKSGVENLVQNPSDDDESSHEEVIHEMSFKTYLNYLFDLDKEIISSEFNPIYNEDLDSISKNDLFDTDSYLLESLLNRDTLMASSPKIVSLLDEFTGELITIPPRIVNREHEKYISLMERLLYDNTSPRSPKDFHANLNMIIESLPTFPIPVEDRYDNPTYFPEFESFHVDYPDLGDSTIDVVDDIPVDMPDILPTHPTLHMDFDFIPSHNDLGSNLDVSSPFRDRNKIYDPGICIEVESTRILATLSPMIENLLLFSFENEDKVFNHGVLASKEKSPPPSSY